MTQVELNKIIEKHQHWLNRDCDGWKDMRAILKGANLYKLNLSHVNLSRAYLGYANLSQAYLNSVNLDDAYLVGANLYDAYLGYANLTLSRLHGANLNGAYLCNANLYKADLTNTNLCGANLVGANLLGADLEKANLYETKLDDSEKYRLGTILTEPIDGYKKTVEGNIIELEIPKGAIVFSINNNKCRTNKAIVKKCEGVQHSIFCYDFKYKEGDVLEIDNFNMQYNIECGEGIHFFRTKKDAKNYII